MILQHHEITPRSLLLAIYGSYHMCLGYDLSKTTVLFHHAHYLEEAEEFAKHFSATRMIMTTRDPRAAFVSSVEHARAASVQRDTYRHLYDSLNGLVLNSCRLEKLDKDCLIVRLEDLPKESILKELAAWLGIEYQRSMTVSTWGIGHRR